MKTLSQITSYQEPIEVSSHKATKKTPSIVKESFDVKSDKTPLVLRKLSEIIEKADDVYNTIFQLRESNEEVRILVESLSKQADTLYEKVDIDHGIIPVKLDESLSWQMTVKTLTKLGFKELEKPTFKTTKGRVQHQFGIAMRAGKWADTFFVILDTDTKPYCIVDDEDETWYENLGDALKALTKLAQPVNKLQDFSEESTDLSEVLDPNDEAGVWIDDFVNSDNKRFEGKSREERIQMALGAWYAAQKKESVD